MDQKTSDLLVELANKLGTKVESLWPILVRREFIDQMCSLIDCGIVILTGLVGFVVTIRLYRREMKTGFSMAGEMAVVGSILSVTAMLGALSIGLTRALPAVLYPEGAALQTLMKLVP